MKKNWTMRAGVSLLALTLITSCFVGGTFAKYVTSGEGQDTARVAKFGITVTGSGDAFSTQYQTHDTDESVTFDNSVKSSNTNNVIAPGTSGTFTKATISGTAEVAVRVTSQLTAFELNENGWTIPFGSSEAEFYCPLILTVKIGETTEKFAVANYAPNGVFDKERFIMAVNESMANESAEFAANQTIALDGSNPVTVGWEWEFDGKAQDATLPGYQTDEKDTLLGRSADKHWVALTLTTTVTQID